MGRYVTHTAWLPSIGLSLIPGLSSTVIGTDTVNTEITLGEAFVDGFAGKLFDPTDYATAPIIRLNTRDIVSYRLFDNYLYNRPEGLQSPVRESLEAKYNTAIAVLEQIRDGDVNLFTSAGVKINRSDQADTVFMATGDFTPTFLEDGELNWTISERKLDQIEIDRETQ